MCADPIAAIFLLFTLLASTDVPAAEKGCSRAYHRSTGAQVRLVQSRPDHPHTSQAVY